MKILSYALLIFLLIIIIIGLIYPTFQDVELSNLPDDIIDSLIEEWDDFLCNLNHQLKSLFRA
jgi:K+-transporting ATPase c subunit